MARKLIDIGIIGNDGTGDSIRDSFRKVNENFYEIYGSLGLGEMLSFTNLGDTPDDYEGVSSNYIPVVDKDPTGDSDKLIFKKITGGSGINISYPESNGAIEIAVNFDDIYSQELLATSIKLDNGISITEFSTDPTFSDNSTSSVPVESAIRGYIDRRLGITHSGDVILSANTIPADCGFLPLTGQIGMRGNINLDLHRVTNLYGDIPTDIDDRDAVNKLIMVQAISDAITGGGAITDAQIDDNADIIQSKLLLTLATPSATAPNGTSAEIQAANGISSFDNTFFTVTNGWVTIKNNSISYDKLQTIGARKLLGNDSNNPGNIIEVSLDDILTGGSSIVNANIASDADIRQSKLWMNIAEERPTWPVGDRQSIQAASGLASFDAATFHVNNGFVQLQTAGVALDKLQIINARSLLGNQGFAPGNVSTVSFDTIINDGLAIKKSQYSNNGFLRRKNSTSYVLDVDYEIIDMSPANIGNRLIQRDSNGDFAARIATLDSLQIDNTTVLDTQVILSGGAVRLYGWNGAGGIMIADGPAAQDKASYYDNDNHKFRTQNGIALAPIEAGTVKTTAITTGDETTDGTIEGRWTLVGDSRLESTYSADLAEYYEGDKEYPRGTVLVFGGEKEITTTNKLMDTRIAGVVSYDAAFAMFKACPGYKNLIALQGRVPCKVVGTIYKGDLLVTSNIPGVAISVGTDAKAGSIIGKALENYNSDHIGDIQVAVGRS